MYIYKHNLRTFLLPVPYFYFFNLTTQAVYLIHIYVYLLNIYTNNINCAMCVYITCHVFVRSFISLLKCK